MDKISIAILLVCVLSQCLCHSSLKMYYVKPAGPSSSSSSECPSSSLPCHSLQYYVNHSFFTNNSLFLFLAGEHHLDSLVDISKVANLSLEGASSGVKIICNSFPSGFSVREFTRLSIKNITMWNCFQSVTVSLNLESGSELSIDNVTVSSSTVSLNLESGSELSIDNVTVSSSSGDATGLQITGVTGSIKVSNSFFPAFQGGSIVVNFIYCNQPSYFNFSNNKVKDSEMTLGFLVDIHSSDVHVLITDSTFQGSRFSINFFELTNTSVMFSNSSFNGSAVVANIGREMRNVHCSHNNLITFTQITSTRARLEVIGLPVDCTVVIEHSVCTKCFISLDSYYFSSNSMIDTSLQAKFNNVTVTNNENSYQFKIETIAVLIVNCTFNENTESAIRAISSKLVFQGFNVFTNNSALIGAGLQLSAISYMFLQPHTHILFENNYAKYVGGAIYTDSHEPDPCFLQVSSLSSETIEVHFINNSAGLGGFSLYGHNIVQCKNLHYYFFNISNTEPVPSALGSDPNKVCFCEVNRNQPNCSDLNKSKSVRVFPGESFFLRLAVVGNNLGGVVTGVIRAFFENNISNATFGPLQSSQVSRKPHCENFTYTIFSTGDKADFTLVPEVMFLNGLVSGIYHVLTVNAMLLRCPTGFDLSDSAGKCECDHVLKENGITCDINDQSILRPANTWIGFLNVSDTPEVIIVFHPHCPIGYCLPYNTSITSNTSDSQCAPHRTGLLCGECEEGYSLTLGNGTCATCSNTYLLLILPLAVSGLLLVAILFALNLTVTEGTINSLIFYANVIGMNHSTLHSGEANWLYAFLAWLNLDLGISTCFYDGMDHYAETWLQFIFPIYLWTIILVIIKLYSRFPTLANRLGGGNAVKVLATLLLLSYTKLQQTVVTIFSFTTLEYPDDVKRQVWLYDANLDYFKGKHIYLGFAGIFVLVFLILPYTLCLVFFQQLQACSKHFPFQWVNKFKPLFDSYAGPYKDKYRFWTGMLLLVRTLLIILFTINTSGSEEFNLLIILIVSFALTLASCNGMYKKWPLNYVEVFFYLQLGVFAGGVKLTSGNVSRVANSSIGLSLAVFLIVMGHHFLLSLKALKGHYYHLIGYADIEEEDDVALTHERFTN